MNRSTIIRIAAAMAFLCGTDGWAYEWPIFRDSVYKPIGNSYGEYQCYGDPCQPYLHTGIDIMAPAGTPVFAIKAGYVKAILTTSAETHWRVVVGDSAGSAECEAWMYAHIDYLSIELNAGLSVGDWVEEGQYLGDVVLWTYNDFNHLHFSKIRFSGETWDNWQDWDFIGNPLDELVDINDPDAPVFENAYGDQKLAFANNQTGIYFAPGGILSGNVDIICRAYDYINDYEHKVTPHGIEYRIDDDPWKTGYCFTGRIGPYAELYDITDIIYRDDEICDSKGDYDFREYFFTVTNSDGDSVIESSDAAHAWPTANYNNGQHIVYLRAWDRAENVTTDSMTVEVENYFHLSGSVAVNDVVPQPLDGILVAISPDGQADTTDESGEFSFDAVGGGTETISVSSPGFITVDTAVMMNVNRTISVTLLPGGYVNGDASRDGTVNIADAIYIVNYVFKGGPAPIPFASGDADCDSAVSIADAVYLISYIFKGGPPPEDCQEPMNRE
jgi:hypothetical protein